MQINAQRCSLTESRHFSKVEALRSVHECAECYLKPLHQISISEFPVAKKIDQELDLNLLLESFVADLSEAKDLLSVERGSQHFMRCRICTKLKGKVLNITRAKAHTFAHTIQNLQKLESCKIFEKLFFSI